MKLLYVLVVFLIIPVGARAGNTPSVLKKGNLPAGQEEQKEPVVQRPALRPLNVDIDRADAYNRREFVAAEVNNRWALINNDRIRWYNQHQIPMTPAFTAAEKQKIALQGPRKNQSATFSFDQESIERLERNRTRR